MDRSAYVVADLAGKHISGVRNPGVGETIMLTAAQAQNPPRLGHISQPKPESAKAGAK